MKTYIWPIALILGVMVAILMGVAWGYAQRDLNDKAQDMMVRQQNAHLERLKEAGMVDPDAPPVTRESMDQRRQEMLRRLHEAGGAEGVARQVHQDVGVAVPPTSTVSPPVQQPTLDRGASGSDATLLFVALGVILVLTFGGLGASVLWFVRADQKAAEAKRAPPPEHLIQQLDQGNAPAWDSSAVDESVPVDV